MFVLTYNSTDELYYNVSVVDQYLLFQNEYTAFSTPFENVKYTSDKEYFYVRYNRYLASYTEGEEYEEISEENVRFARSLTTLSSNIMKINFFWIGEVVNEEFVATTPVMEIVYYNGTSDIAVIKDISPNNFKSAISYY
jgi:hypothetical protein